MKKYSQFIKEAKPSYKIYCDLDGVLVGAHRAVGAQSEKHRPFHALGLGVEGFVHLEREIGHIVGDAHGEMGLGRVFLELVEHHLDHGRGEFLG